MEAFIALCTRSLRWADDDAVKEPREYRSESPNPVIQEYVDCANFARCVCFAQGKELKKWHVARVNGVYYRFCSPECWSEWASDPSHIACWSPQQRPEMTETPLPPSMDLND